jgi:hypothetical protein
MAGVVSLRAVVNEIESLIQNTRGFLNRRTGELCSFTDEHISRAEEGNDDELAEWEAEVIEKLREVLGASEWIELPAPDRDEEYRTIERFCWNQREGQLRDELLSAIQGRGAFRRFFDLVKRNRMLEAWDNFHRKTIEEEVDGWLQANDIPYGP